MLRALAVIAAMAAVASTASAKVYFKETFDSGDWESKWTVGGDGWGKTLGKWELESSLSDEADKGLKTGEDARHYALTAKLDGALDNSDKPLVLSYTVRHTQTVDCGGSYIKLAGDVDQSKFSGDTEYAVMFGPDVCGTATRKTHAILGYKGADGKSEAKNLEKKTQVRVLTDNEPHRYTFVIQPDNTYSVSIDGEEEAAGSLYDEWAFLQPKEIDDPEDKKPADWVDEAQIPDPEAKKPDGWDDVPEFIPDADAEKPDDWDDEEDGEWEAPQIKNPDYKGEWKAPMIPNPEYKGVWKPKRIANPEYVEDDKVHAVCGAQGGCSTIGFELWQVKSGTVFDDIIVTDSVEEADAFAKETFAAKVEAEKKALEAKKEAEAKKAAEEREAAAAAAADADEEEEEEEEL